jgi:hypothetical protein
MVAAPAEAGGSTLGVSPTGAAGTDGGATGGAAGAGVTLMRLSGGSAIGSGVVREGAAVLADGARPTSGRVAGAVMVGGWRGVAT